MSERAKTTRPQRTRPARDPRIDSMPPVVDEEAPLKAKPLRSGADPLQARVALLEAELESLKVARAADSDDLAQMLIRVAEAERLREAAEQRARDAEAASVAQGETLQSRVAEADQKRAAVEKQAQLAEAEHASGQQALFDQLVEAQRARDAVEQRSRDAEAGHAAELQKLIDQLAEAARAKEAAERRAADAEARHTAAVEALGVAQARAREAAPVSTVDARALMDQVESWLEELERGETMAQALRVWMIQQARLAARKAVSVPGVDVTPAAPPIGDTVALDDADVEPVD